jgi:acyl-CoA reductase-like NAD-dependent aldehyde dehydrogenase
MSVLVRAMLVQALAGNAVIAKTPTGGGLACLALATALAAREGIPLTLVSGSGGELSEALVRASEIGCVSFVGGRDTGARIATAVADLGNVTSWSRRASTPGAAGTTPTGPCSAP